jgi:hypothetical protein
MGTASRLAPVVDTTLIVLVASGGSWGQFVPNPLEERFEPAFLYGLKCNPIDSRGSIIQLGQSASFPKRLELGDVNVKAPKAPGPLSLRLVIYPLGQVLQ